MKADAVTLALALLLMLLLVLCAGAADAREIAFQNKYAKLVVSSDGRVSEIIDRGSGVNHALSQAGPIASVRRDGKVFAASSVEPSSDGLAIRFGDSGIEATVNVSAKDDYFSFEVVSVNTDKLDELTFADFSISQITPSFSCAALAMNLNTNVPDLPGDNSVVVAKCIPRFGLVGAKLAVILSPRSKMRAIMKEVVTAAKDHVPYNAYGGPWAQDYQFNRSSYIVDCMQMKENTVDDWIKVCNGTGIKQVDINNWNFYDGEYDVDPNLIPGGKAALKRIIAKLHAAGIKCGLHTYSFLITRGSPRYVSPTPDTRLAKSATFNLAQDIGASDTEISVQASTAVPSSTNHVLRIDNELIKFGGVSGDNPRTFTGCVRGAFGTKASPHKTSASVDNLKEVYDMFMPDVNTTLFKEVADNIAGFYNECGFDMIYFDAIDSFNLLDGDEHGWYWATYFVSEVLKQLKKPPIMEASCMWHGMWFARSRMGAWDVAIRNAKDDVDLHCAANLQCETVFLPGHLGWCNVFGWDPVQPERTFPDDIEYMCCKGLAWNCGLSMQSYLNPYNYLESENAQRLGGIIKRYEGLRSAGYFSQSVRDRLKAPGSEYTLDEAKKGKWTLRPVSYSKHRVQGADPSTSAWSVNNQYASQPVQIRIEALMSVAPYDSPDGVTITTFGAGKYAQPVQISGAKSSFTTGVHPELGRPEEIACYKAVANSSTAWVAYKEPVTPVVDGGPRALGVWIYGDGNGELLDFRTDAVRPASTGITDHCVKINHTGWKYFELVEPDEGEVVKYDWPSIPKKPDWSRSVPRLQDASWNLYIMFGPVNTIGALGLWYNGLPVGKEVTTYISPVKALTLKRVKLINPTVELNGRKLTFPVTLESGSYIEYRSADDCKIYDAAGSVINKSVKPIGKPLTAKKGTNQAKFHSETPGGENPRVNVTIITKGAAVPNN